MQEIILDRNRVVQDLLATLRNLETPDGGRDTPFYRTAALLSELVVVKLAGMIAPTEQIDVHTPLDATVRTDKIMDRSLAFLSIERAGGVMLDAAQRWFPDATFGRLRLKRQEEPPFAPIEGEHDLPETLQGKVTIILDPMLATGGSASSAIRTAWSLGAPRVGFAGFVGAPEGLARLRNECGIHDPYLLVVLAARDKCLNDRAYILPGLGDAGDRLFGKNTL